MDAETIHRRRWAILGVMALSLLVIGLDNTILNVALPTLVRELGASASQLQWMVDAYILVFAGLLLTMGALGDRFGRKRALTVGLLLFGLGSLGAAFSGSANMLIATRAAMGIGGALIMPSTLSIITNVFSGPERGRAIAAWAAVSGLGIIGGPVLGGWLLENFWWGSVFLVNVPIVLIAVATGYFLVPESKDPNATPLDPVGAGAFHRRPLGSGLRHHRGALQWLDRSADSGRVRRCRGVAWFDGLVGAANSPSDAANELLPQPQVQRRQRRDHPRLLCDVRDGFHDRPISAIRPRVHALRGGRAGDGSSDPDHRGAVVGPSHREDSARRSS